MGFRLTRRSWRFVIVGGALALAAVLAIALTPRRAPRSGAPPTGSCGSAADEDFTESDGVLAEYVQRLRRSGEPTSLEEAVEQGAPEDGPAAPWVAIRSVTSDLDRELTSEFGRDPPFWPWDGAWTVGTETPENLARLAALAPRLESVSEVLASALQAPRLRFPFELDDSPDVRRAREASSRQFMDRTKEAVRARADGSDIPLPPDADDRPAAPSFPNLRARVTVRRALSAAAVGSSAASKRLAAIRALLVFGRKDEPPKLPELIGDADCLTRAVEVTRFGIEQGTLHPVEARAALDVHLAGSAIERLPGALAGERGYVIDLYRTRRMIGLGPAPRLVAAKRVVDACEGMRDVALLRSKSPSIRDADWLREVRRICASPGRQEPALPQAAEKLVRCDAATRLARIALAAAEFRTVHGDFPGSLAEVAPSFPDGAPVDPFTGRPFAYTVTATAVRIASAGCLQGEKALDEETLREQCLVWELKR